MVIKATAISWSLFPPSLGLARSETERLRGEVREILLAILPGVGRVLFVFVGGSAIAGGLPLVACVSLRGPQSELLRSPHLHRSPPERPHPSC